MIEKMHFEVSVHIAGEPVMVPESSLTIKESEDSIELSWPLPRGMKANERFEVRVITFDQGDLIRVI